MTWIQETINVLEHGLRGLFNFSMPLSAHSRLQQHVDNEVCQHMEEASVARRFRMATIPKLMPRYQ